MRSGDSVCRTGSWTSTICRRRGLRTSSRYYELRANASQHDLRSPSSDPGSEQRGLCGPRPDPDAGKTTSRPTALAADGSHDHQPPGLKRNPLAGRPMLSKTLRWFGALLFTILVPGSVTVALSYYILGRSFTFDRQFWSLPQSGGLALLLVGLAVYLWCLWDFVVAGRGRRRLSTIRST